MVSLFFFFVTETYCDTSVKFKSCFTHFEEVPEQLFLCLNQHQVRLKHHFPNFGS